MPLNLVSQNGLCLASDATASCTVDRWRDVWDTEAHTRAIVDPSGATTTFTYDAPSRTVIQFPTGGRATLAWCQSQTTSAASKLSHFAAHVRLRSQSAELSANARAGTFLTHPESQRHISGVANGALRTLSKRRGWLDDVVQQANLQLLVDLHRGKLVFRGDDPERFVRWFHGASRHAVADAIKFCLRGFAGSGLGAKSADISDGNAGDPAEIVTLREFGQLVGEAIERFREPELREAMRDLRDGRSARDSASRLGISKTAVGRMQERGCQQIARSLGK